MRYFGFLIAWILITGCDPFEGDQTVPSYLQADTLGFVTDPDVQGSPSQDIADVWVYVDDDLVGGFELPALIPVLAEGVHKLELRAGVLLNGISDTRAPNPCWKPIIYESFRFTMDSVTSVTGTTTYYENVTFAWMENFEDASLAIRPSQNSDTGIVRTQPANAPEAFTEDFSQFSGVSHLDKTHRYLQLVSDNGNESGFAFDRGDYIFLELNYKNNIPLVIGVYITRMDYTVEDRSFLILPPKEEWNKIYVNFTPVVNETVEALTYMFYFEAVLPADMDNAALFFDNIKLVTRPNL